MSSSYKTYNLIVIPSDEMRTEMEKFGFEFLFHHKEIFTECYIPPGWKIDVIPTFMHIYLPNTSHEFIIPYETRIESCRQNDTFKFPYHERTIFEELLKHGFKFDGSVGTIPFPIGVYEYCNLIIPEDWCVIMTWQLPYNVCRIYKPYTDKEYHIVTAYKKKYEKR